MKGLVLTVTLDTRIQRVYDAAWAMLPPLKNVIVLDDILIDDLGAVHGTYNHDTHILTLNERLFWGENATQIKCIDIDGNSPPLTYPFCSRALHTTIHELFHALGNTLHLDDSPEWLALSDWVEDDDDPPGTARYYENRPGWEQGASSWRHRAQHTWFVRDYSSKSPFEDFADAATHVALGWSDFFGVSGYAKLAYLREKVWQEQGQYRIVAARERWRKQLQRVV